MTALRPAFSLVLALVLGAWSVQMRWPGPAPAASAPMPCHSEPGNAPMAGMDGLAHAPAQTPRSDGPAKPEAPMHCSPGSACPLCVALATPALLPLRAIGPAPLGPPLRPVVRAGRPAEPPTPPPRQA